MRFTIIVVFTLLTLVACAGIDADQLAGTGIRLPIVPETVIAVELGGNKELGDFLVDADGMTLYTYAKDEADRSHCYGQCMENWPPLLVEKGTEPVGGEGVAGELGVIERDDGSLQVTYNGAPLYRFAKDEQTGDTYGHQVGGVWLVAR